MATPRVTVCEEHGEGREEQKQLWFLPSTVKKGRCTGDAPPIACTSKVTAGMEVPRLDCKGTDEHQPRHQLSASAQKEEVFYF